VKKRNGGTETPDSDDTAVNQVYRFDGEQYSPES
jgi:hypothetical protein